MSEENAVAKFAKYLRKNNISLFLRTFGKYYVNRYLYSVTGP